MKYNFHFFSLPFLLIFISSCEPRIVGVYTSYYAETTWIYEFSKDGTYTFRTYGHMGESYETGSYYIRENTVTLYNEVEDPYFENGGLRLYRLNNKCIITTYGQEYCNEVTEFEVVGMCDDYKFSDSIRNYIVNSDEYIERAEMLNQMDSTLDLSIDLERVIKVRDKILDVYQVRHYYRRQNRMISPFDLRFYVDRCNREIYTGGADNLRKVKR